MPRDRRTRPTVDEQPLRLAPVSVDEPSADVSAETRRALHERAVGKGVNPVVYGLARLVLVPFFRVWFRLRGVGRDNVPRSGAVIIAANHRSFLDPFVIGAVAGRPIYFVAKKELFRKRFQGWLLNSLGAFPIDRGNADGDAMATARTLLERGEVVVIFPEGTRTRPGGLGEPRRGVGRLALETGVPVLPVTVHGTTHVRKGSRIRPHRVTVRVGRPLTFPLVAAPTAELAQSVTNRVWPIVQLGWDALGGHRTERGIGVDRALLAADVERPSGRPAAASGPATTSEDADGGVRAAER